MMLEITKPHSMQSKAAVDYDGFSARRQESESRGMKRGIGFSCYVEACGIAPSQAVGSLGAGVGLWESAEVRVNPTGSIEILTGAHSHGQGHETTFAQLVADRLGVGTDTVSIVHGDTEQNPIWYGYLWIKIRCCWYVSDC